MAKAVFTQEEMRRFDHPFMASVANHLNATHAFASHSKLTVGQNVALMYWFVAGAKYPDIQKISHYVIPDGDKPNHIHLQARDEIPIQTIRRKYNQWREYLFYNERFRNHIFITALSKSYLLSVYGDDIVKWASAFSGLMPSPSDNESNRNGKESGWSKIRECLYGCTRDCTVPEFKRKFSSITPTDLYIVAWRGLLGEDSWENGFKEWYTTRFAPIADKMVADVNAWRIRKSACDYCPAPIIKNTYKNLSFDIMKYLSNFHAPSELEFPAVFCSAVLFALGRANLWLPIREMKMQHERWDMLSAGDKEDWSKNIYEIDKLYQRYVNAVAGAMIDSLSEDQIT